MDWVTEGLRFQCQPDCGRCCTNERGGCLYLEPADLEHLAAHFGITTHQFVSEHTERDEFDDLTLRMSEDGSCPFLQGKICGVYASRPLQCRAYPFLPLDGFSPLSSEESWREEEEFCPGVGKGPLHTSAHIDAISRGRNPAPGFEV